MGWTYQHFFVVKNKLKKEGLFYLPISIPGGFIAHKKVPFVFDSQEKAKSGIRSYLLQMQRNYLYSNTFYPTAVPIRPIEFKIKDQKMNALQREWADFLKTIVKPISQDINRLNRMILERLFGECELMLDGDNYFLPKASTEMGKYFYIKKTSDSPRIDPDLLTPLMRSQFGEPLKRSYELFMVQVHHLVRQFASEFGRWGERLPQDLELKPYR